MNTEIKNLADSGDLKSLKYIFVDSLDVDPTFVRYEEEYNYCKSIHGLLEQHIELTPFTQDESMWNESYWTKLKMDLVKNFSDDRMTHMREVAKVFLAEKIQRILSERANGAIAVKSNDSEQETKAASIEKQEIKTNSIPQSAEQRKTIQVSKAAEQEREIKREKERLEQERRAEEARIYAEEQRRKEQRLKNEAMGQAKKSGMDSKKAIGIAIAAAAVIVIILILLLE